MDRAWTGPNANPVVSRRRAKLFRSGAGSTVAAGVTLEMHRHPRHLPRIHHRSVAPTRLSYASVVRWPCPSDAGCSRDRFLPAFAAWVSHLPASGARNARASRSARMTSHARARVAAPGELHRRGFDVASRGAPALVHPGGEARADAIHSALRALSRSEAFQSSYSEIFVALKQRKGDVALLVAATRLPRPTHSLGDSAAIAA